MREEKEEMKGGRAITNRMTHCVFRFVTLQPLLRSVVRVAWFRDSVSVLTVDFLINCKCISSKFFPHESTRITDSHTQMKLNAQCPHAGILKQHCTVINVYAHRPISERRGDQRTHKAY